VCVEVEGAANLLEELGAGLVVALVGDAEGGEAEAGGGDGGHAVVRIDFGGKVERGVDGGGAVEDLAGGGAGLLDEEEAGATLHVVEEGVVFVGERVVRCGLGCEVKVDWSLRGVLGEGMEAREERSAGEELEAIAPLHNLFSDQHDGEAVCGYCEFKFTVVEAEVLGGCHGTRGAELLDLCGR